MTLKHVNGRNVWNSTIVKVRYHPGATTEDLIDYVKSIAYKKLKILFIHSGTHDLPNDMDTIKKLKKKMVQSINELEFSEEIQIDFSGIINPKDNNFA